MEIETNTLTVSRISSPSSSTGCNSSLEGDHFPSNLAHEEIRLALNNDATQEELENAVTRCKNLVLETDQCSTERKWLVRHLIELRLRLQECKDALTDPHHPRNKSSGASTRTIRGHHLILQPFLKSSVSKYCDHCTGAIWHVIQAWYKCEDCGYSCHHKCITSILRECAHVTATERGNYELEICPEEGLSAQQYKCAECKTPLPINTLQSCTGTSLLLDSTMSAWTGSTANSFESREFRLCDYSGLYYCNACHWASQAVIPARVLRNWDFGPRPVGQASLQQLRLTSTRPLINVEQLNAALFGHSQELALVRRLRRELNAMWRYLVACRIAREDHLLWRLLVDEPHLVQTPDLYSLQNLLDTNSGELPSRLETLQCRFLEHIKDSCDICKGRGHICETCSNDEVLFPFDAIAITCKKCFAVLHKMCFKRKPECPKCLRLQKKLIDNKDPIKDSAK